MKTKAVIRAESIARAQLARRNALLVGGKGWTTDVGEANMQLAKLGALPTPPHTPTLRLR